MEPEVGSFGSNVTATNNVTSGSDGGGGDISDHDDAETLQSSGLLLWVPHASIGLLLLLLVLLSFARFHSKHGHKYRKSTKGPRPAWQELGMHDFLWQMHQQQQQQQMNTSADATINPGLQACQLYQGCVWYHDVVGSSALPASSSEFGRPVSAGSGPTLTLLHSPNSSVHVMSEAGTSSPDSGTGSVSNSSCLPKTGPTYYLPRPAPDVLPRMNSTPVTSHGVLHISPHSGPSPTPVPTPSTIAGSISVSNPGPSSSSSVFEMSASTRSQDSVPATTSGGSCEKTEVSTSADLLPPRPSFIWTLGTDRVRDSSAYSGGQKSPEVKAKVVSNGPRERSRAGSEVVLRSAGQLRAITAVALSNVDAEDKESLLKKSPI